MAWYASPHNVATCACLPSPQTVSSGTAFSPANTMFNSSHRCSDRKLLGTPSTPHSQLRRRTAQCPPTPTLLLGCFLGLCLPAQHFGLVYAAGHMRCTPQQPKELPLNPVHHLAVSCTHCTQQQHSSGSGQVMTQTGQQSQTAPAVCGSDSTPAPGTC